MAADPPAEPLDLEVDVEGVPPELRLVARGELDLHTAPVLQDALRAAATPGTERIVVDCQGVEFVDSAGLRALLVARNELAASGVRVVLAEPSPALERVLEMTNLRASLSE
jgi:anti-sigma B factor antagonist